MVNFKMPFVQNLVLSCSSNAYASSHHTSGSAIIKFSSRKYHKIMHKILPKYE